ncbi:MAG TPA: formimidoylglutamase [Burkholderiaceae bacterium]|nr:formimidoylglutamase [Burkholderiaceae bacterium]HRZ00618.1 formimidoylglutamase [Burkholderiaceae bacterium]
MRAFDPTLWQGRVDAAEGELGRRWHQAMRPLDAHTPSGSAVLIGFACDAGVARNHGRTGASEGPRALRLALRNLALHDCRALADAGDVVCEGDALEAAQEELAQLVAAQLRAGRFPVVLGGGHEVAFGSFGGLARHLAAGEPAPRVGIVNFDAHFDLRRDERATSGTPFLQIAEHCAARGWPFRYACLGVSRYANTQALFARAAQLGVLWREDAQCAAPETASALAGFVDAVDHVYLTVCLDALPGAVVPGVSAPAARGVELGVLEPLIDAVCASGKVRVADLAELNPRFDLDGRSAAVAARLAARIVDGVARAGR